MYILGIDPGSKGGWVLFDGDQVRMKGKVPTLPETLRWLAKQPQKIHAYVEELGPIRHQGIKGPYGQGRNLGWVLGALDALQIPYTIIKPQDWQEAFMLGGKKKGLPAPSIAAAAAIWPDQFNAKSPDGQTDAALIGYFGVLNHEVLAVS